MRERGLTILLSVVMAVVIAAGALAQSPPEASPPGSPAAVGERPSGGSDRGRMIDFGQVFQADLAWLRGHDLGSYADKVAELSQSDHAMKRIILWRVHRRIDGWKRLQGDDLRRALEEVRLEFTMVKLAQGAREATEGPAREQARGELRRAIERQVDLRMEVNKAMIEMIEKRLVSFREQLDKQAALRQDLVAQRLASLMDVSSPLPDPVKDLVMEASEPEHEGRPKPPPPPEEGGKAGGPPPAMPGSMGRLAESFDRQMDADIQWLREKGLPAFADRLAAIRKESSAEGNRFLLWQIYRRIQQIKSLDGDDATTAIEGERLRFAVIEQARQWRAASAEARPALGEKLKEGLLRQFDLRQKAQEAILAGIKRRLAETQANVEKLQRNREAIMERRFEELTDAGRAIPEPSLLPEPRGDPRRGGRGDRDGRPGPGGEPGSIRSGDRSPPPADEAPPAGTEAGRVQQ